MTEPFQFAPGTSAAEIRRAWTRRIASLFFGVGIAVSLCGALLYGVLPLSGEPAMRHWVVLACAVQAAVFAAGAAMLWRGRTDDAQPLVLVACVLGTGVTVLTGLASGDGVHTLSLGFLGLLVCLATVLCGLRAGIALAVVSGAAVLLVARSHFGSPLTAATALGSPVLLNLSTLAVMLLTALGSGALISRMLHGALAEAEERHQRFVNLLRIGADWYWELDEQLRFKPTSVDFDPDAAGRHEQRVGKRPWEVENVDWPPEQIERHRRLLEARQPLTHVPMKRRDAHGQMHYFSVSGRPQFDADGRFLGYWGIGLDETAEMHARLAVSDSESRYREVFERSPSPLILHRRGLVIDANEAAAQLFGFESAAAMTGVELLVLTQPGVNRERAQQRIAQLDTMPAGAALEVTDYDMQARDGARLSVQATGVRVNTPDGLASLSIYFDITARAAAESALRRSEAMLSHLFATSPDFITMSEMQSGRYAMVNPSFCRIFGFTGQEVLGKTVSELGIWTDRGQRQRMVDQLVSDGMVYDLPVWFNTKAGVPKSVLISAGRVRMDGRDYIVVNGRDVTDTQRARLEQEAILQNASIGIAMVRDGHFTRANPSFETMFGWELGLLPGEQASVVWPQPEQFDAALHEMHESLARGEPVEMERPMRRRDGSTFWCRLLAQVVDPMHPRLGGTIWIAEDVTERRRVDQTLAAARDAAEAASRAKSAFLANTSHEIRTPLNGLIGLARLAMQHGTDEKRRNQYLEQIHDSARNLADIISDILDLSKIEAGKFQLESTPFDLRRLLGAVHHAYQSLADGRALALTLRIADDVPAMVRGDPVRVRQILSNYITNGLKFTEHGTVEIAASKARPGVVRLIVSDTGPGIDDGVQQRLFQPFTQADTSTTRRYGGTGLGLSICKELATLMGGEVGVHSQPGRGSRFWVELPLPSAEDTPGDGDGDSVEGARLAGLDVLLVEDNPVNMMIGVALLEQWGMHVVQAGDGHEAVLAVDRAARAGAPFDVVLMDVQMPRLSGYEAAAELRQRYDAQRLPIIALTAAALVSEREQALAVGMNDFLTKPIDPPKLRRTLLRVLSQRHAMTPRR